MKTKNKSKAVNILIYFSTMYFSGIPNLMSLGTNVLFMKIVTNQLMDPVA